jgi:cell wall-associated NlpC family hydrolase
MTEQEARAVIVAEAKSFLLTPYHHHATIKGAGVDCLTLITCVAENVGLGKFELPPYSAQFGQNRDEETYLRGLQKHCREVNVPQAGDIAIYKFGRVFSHAAIVINWPTIIHANSRCGVVYETAEAHWLKYIGKNPRPVKFFSYF